MLPLFGRKPQRILGVLSALKLESGMKRFLAIYIATAEVLKKWTSLPEQEIRDRERLD